MLLGLSVCPHWAHGNPWVRACGRAEYLILAAWCQISLQMPGISLQSPSQHGSITQPLLKGGTREITFCSTRCESKFSWVLRPVPDTAQQTGRGEGRGEGRWGRVQKGGRKPGDEEREGGLRRRSWGEARYAEELQRGQAEGSPTDTDGQGGPLHSARPTAGGGRPERAQAHVCTHVQLPCRAPPCSRGTPMKKRGRPSSLPKTTS